MRTYKEIVKNYILILSTFMKNLFFSFLSYPLNRITRKRFDRVLWKKCIRMFIILTNVQVKKHLRFFFVSAI